MKFSNKVNQLLINMKREYDLDLKTCRDMRTIVEGIKKLENELNTANGSHYKFMKSILDDANLAYRTNEKAENNIVIPALDSEDEILLNFDGHTLWSIEII